MTREEGERRSRKHSLSLSLSDCYSLILSLSLAYLLYSLLLSSLINFPYILQNTILFWTRSKNHWMRIIAKHIFCFPESILTWNIQMMKRYRTMMKINEFFTCWTLSNTFIYTYVFLSFYPSLYLMYLYQIFIHHFLCTQRLIMKIFRFKMCHVFFLLSNQGKNFSH